MSVLFIALPLSLLVASIAVIAFVRAARGGQFDDLETPAIRVLYDDVAGESSSVQSEPVKSIPENHTQLPRDLEVSQRHPPASEPPSRPDSDSPESVRRLPDF